MNCLLPCGPDLPTSCKQLSFQPWACHAHETPKPRDTQTMPGAGHRGDQEEVHVQEQATRHHHQARAPREEAMSITYQNAACSHATATQTSPQCAARDTAGKACCNLQRLTLLSGLVVMGMSCESDQGSTLTCSLNSLNKFALL